MSYHVSDTLISKTEIEAMVDRVAQEINETYKGEPLIVIGILTGAYVFTADLVRKLDMPVTVDFMQVKSYSGQNSTGNFQILKDTSFDLADKNVLVVEDIIDTGRTLSKLKEMLKDRGTKSLRICTAFDKPDRRVVDIKPDFNGIVIPDEFIVGYGLDYDGLYRNFEDVRYMSKDV